jgi:amino acid adenylation domain-containing protein
LSRTPPFSLPPTLVEVARRRAAEHPERPVYTFLTDGEEEGARLSYGELDLRARTIAARLQALGVGRGERALLLFPPGLDFVTAFLGCLYAGVVAVPAYPPRSRRLLPRLQAIAADARPRVALTVDALLPRLSQAAAELPGLIGVSLVATDGIEPGEADGFRPPELRPADLAFLQYTSGSTSTPKGVEVTHGNLVHNEEMIRRAFGQSEESVVVGWLPLYHDMGLIGNVLQPLYVGGRCILMSPVAFLQRPRRWLEAISRYRATTSGGPDFAYELCVQRIGEEERRELDLASWRVAYDGAEPVRAATLERFAAAFAPVGFRRQAFYPCYGLAEATLFVTGGMAGAGASVLEIEGRPRVSCGVPWLGQEVAIVDPESRRRVAGERVGEIWVAGPSVAAGYWGQPEATERDFRARLAGAADGGPWLRTGDLGQLSGGELFVTGRLKDLIILRGRNLYPQDLEATAAASHPALGSGGGAAFSVEVAGEERLILVQETLGRPDSRAAEEVAGAIRRAVAEEHEAQVWEVVLLRSGTLPRTSSGKVQRHACRAGYLAGTLETVGRSALASPGEPAGEPPPERLERAALLALPEGERRAALEAYLAVEAARRLRLPAGQVEPGMPLSGMGLDSLSAVEIRRRVEEDLGVSPSLSGLLEGWSVRELAGEILAMLAAALEPILADTAGGLAGQPQLLPTGEEPAEFPLSSGQRGLWFLSRLAPESAAYNIVAAARVRGGLDSPALERALRALVARHGALRTTFPSFSGEPRQRVAERGELDFREVNAAEWEEERVAAWLAEEGYRPFDLENGPLLRVRVLRGAEESEPVVLLAVHHLVSDFASLAVMVRELAALYREELGGPPALLPRPLASYADFVRWQEELLASPEGERQERYWRERLAGELPVLDLPADRPRPPVQTDRGGAVSLHLAGEPLARLRALGRQRGATLYMTLLAAFQTLLHRYTGEEDVLVGSPTAGRGAAALAEVVGYFVNPLVLRSDLSGDPPFTGLLDRVRRTALDAFAHSDLPFPRLAEELQPVRDPSRSPVFQVLFVLQQGVGREAPLAAFALGESGPRLAFDDLTLEPLPLPERRAQFDLTLMAVELAESAGLEETGGGLAATLEYNADLFDRTTARRLAGNLLTLLTGIAERPEEALGALPLLTAPERAQLLDWSGSSGAIHAGPPARCLHELVLAQADRTPEAEALVWQGERLTYAELAARAGRLARRLRRYGVGPEVSVAICARRTPDLVAGLLGILQAGGAYVPMEPSLPDERLAFLLRSSGAPLLVTESGLAERLEALAPAGCQVLRRLRRDEPDEPEEAACLPQVLSGNLAYIIYTSGSTGEPKGVAISHASAVALVRWAGTVFPAADLSGVLASTSVGFDLSVFELFVPLAHGGRVILAADALELPRLAAAGEVTLVNTVPSVLAELLRGGPLPPSVRTVNLAGEPLPGPLVRQVRSARVFNLYGPSEDTTYSIFAAADPRSSGTPPIGRPLPGTRVWLLDPRLQPVPAGVPGELFLGGAGLARGYLGRPDLTAERFVPDPFSSCGARLYRTGDLARFRAGAELEFLGRLDHQVKVRGFRIELGEIEAVLGAHPEVAAAAVLASGEGADRRLVAYVAAPAGSAFDAELRSFLRARLPEYMVPAVFVVLDALPLTPNGKVDRRALARIAPALGVGETPGGGARAPQGRVEEGLAAIWRDLLGVERVTAESSFFDLGGHSLLATRLLARVQTAFGVDLPLPSLFAAPTLAGFAARIGAALSAPAAPFSNIAPPPPPIPRLAPAVTRPLSFSQRRLWFLNQLEPESPAYNMPAVLRFLGPLAVPALAASLGEIVRRHEILRTSFVLHGEEPVQVVTPQAGPFVLPEVDLGALPGPARETEAERLAREEARRPFDLGQGLCRFRLLRLSPGEHRLWVNLHHAAADGWSLGILVGELAALYAVPAGAPSPLPELPVQFGDYAAWQRRWAAGEGELAWWRERLAGPLPHLNLPADRPRLLPRPTGDRGAVASARLAPELDAALLDLAHRQGATRFMVLAVGLAALLGRYAGGEDLLLGTPVANRRQPQVEGLIGPFLNLLLLRIDLSGDPAFGELVARVRSATLGALAHQDLPFERLVEELHPQHGLARGPLFQVLLALEEAPLAKPALAGLDLEVLPLSTGTAKFELALTVTAGGSSSGLAVAAEYAADLFDGSTIERLLRDFAALLAGAVAGPDRALSELSPLRPGERQQLLAAGQPDRRTPLRPAPAYVSPRGPIEERLAELWRDLLGIERVSANDSFFDLGGHSLLATRLLVRVRAAFGTDLSLPVLAEAPTLSGLARRIVAALRDSRSPVLPPVVAAPRPAPLSFAQRRLWFLHQLEPESPAYNMPAAVRLRGTLDAGALALSLGEIVARHEALRTRIVLAGEEPLQAPEPPGLFALPLADLAALPAPLQEAEGRRIAVQEARLPFADLARSAPCRFRLVRLGPADHLLLATFHHLVMDGWSLGVFVRELTLLYPAFFVGRPSPLPPLRVQYADWAVWQQRWAAGEGELAWWRERLAGELPDASLPADRPYPIALSGRGAVRSLALPPGLSPALAALGREERTTLFMTLAAGFLALLSRWTGAEDLLLGTPVANRRAPEIEEGIGLFVNTVVLRGDLSGRPDFRTLLGRVREEVLGAYGHQDLPFERLVEVLHRRRLFQAVFTLEEPLLETARLPGLALERMETASGTAKFDLTLNLTHSGEGLGASLEYATDLFDATTVERLLGVFAILLSGVAAAPGRPVVEIELLSGAQRHQLAAEWNDTAVGIGEETLGELFLRQVKRVPEAVAVSFRNKQVSYGELARRSGSLALRLRERGVGPEVPVGLQMERSIELVVAILAVVRAGGVYVPLDPAYPRERLEMLIADSGARVVLGRGAAGSCGPASSGAPRSQSPVLGPGRPHSSVEPLAGGTAEQLAYLIYTSGSTGVPKGVAVPHRAVARLILGANYVTLSGADRIAQVSTPSFDAATFEIWGALLTGARLVVFPPGARSLAELGREIRQSEVTVLWLTAGLFHQMVESHLEDLIGVGQLLAGGDVLSPMQVARLRRSLPGCRLINGYGPSEGTTFTCCYWVEVADPGSPVPIGRPISNTTATVLDRELRPVPIGVAGELCAGGLGLARGYWGDPARTAEKFVPDAGGAVPGERLYRTGDRVRLWADGRVEFLGRLDRQVKVRGFRVEPGEVEAALAGHPGVRAAAVDVRPEPGGGRHLVAWVVGEVPALELRRYLLAKLPEHAVPVAFFPLSGLPLTPQGKVDRKALSEAVEPAGGEPADAAGEGDAPRTPFEEVLAAIWAEVLGRERVGVSEDFFALGGHSLLATRVASRVRSAFGVEFPLSELFEAPTVTALAARIEAALRTAGGAAVPPLVLSPRDAPLPLSFAQERLWFLDQLEPESPFYNIAGGVRLVGDLAVPALASSLAEVVARHEALRTTFAVAGGEPVQRIAPPGPFRLPGVDLSVLPESRREGEARRLAAALAVLPFDLGRGPLLRTTLLDLGASQAVLVLVVHHIVADGWSMEILLREAIAVYGAHAAGRPSPLPPLPLQYADFAVWQRRWLSGEVLARQLAYWRTALAGAPAVLALPADRPRPVRQSFAGGELRSLLPAETREALLALARREGASLFMVLLAAFEALLGRHTGQEDLTIGTPVANRGHHEIEGLIGFFTNTLVLRGDLAGDPPFSGLLARVRRAALDAYAHEDVPFEKLVAELAPRREVSHHPLFQVLVNLEDLTAGPGAPPLAGAGDLGGLAMSPLAIPDTAAKFDLTLVAKTVDGALHLTWSYARALFDRTTVARLAGHFEVLLAGCLADPGRPLSALPLLTAPELQQVGGEWNDTEVDFGVDGCFHQLFAGQAERTPEAVALEMEGELYTYGELEARSNQLAHYLVSLGVEPEVRVAVFLPRTPQAMLSLLAIWKAGGVYLPLPVSYPPERLAFILTESESRVILTRRELLGRLPAPPALAAEPRMVLVDAEREAIERSSRGPLASTVLPAHLAYLFYTSGSTGRPKGVMIEHRNLVNFLLGYVADVRLRPGDVLPAWTLASFDPALLEWFTPLLSGARVVVISEELLLDLPALTEVLRGATALDGVPSLYRQIALHLEETGQTEGWDLIRTVTLGGESVATDLLLALHRIFPRAELRNSYGPTETTVLCTSYPAHFAGLQGDIIGRPLANMALRLLDREGRPVPIGVAGEIWIGGKGVGRGYLGRPDQTAERFGVASGERAFRTGDLARYRPDGYIEFLGRIDNQVKIRGLRIELGEIEATLALHPQVAEVAVLAREETGGKRLVAYVVPRSGARLDPAELRALAAERLPDYMVPTALVLLDRLPRTSHGKLDRAALPAPERPRSEAAHAAPRNDLERAIAAVWREVLGPERLAGLAEVGIDDNFFELGGDSLLLIRLRSRLQAVVGRDLPVVALFQYPTIRSLAESLPAKPTAPAAPPVAEEEVVDRGQSRRESLARLQERRGRGRR